MSGWIAFGISGWVACAIVLFLKPKTMAQRQLQEMAHEFALTRRAHDDQLAALREMLPQLGAADPGERQAIIVQMYDKLTSRHSGG